MLIVFGFYYGQGLVIPHIENIVCPLRTFPMSHIASKADSSIGDFCFHGNPMKRPLCCNRRSYIMQLNVLLRHLLFFHNHCHPNQLTFLPQGLPKIPPTACDDESRRQLVLFKFYQWKLPLSTNKIKISKTFSKKIPNIDYILAIW